MELVDLTRVRCKHFLRNSINQGSLGVDLQTSMMELLQAMEKSDHVKKRIQKRIAAQNIAASNTTLRRLN